MDTWTSKLQSITHNLTHYNSAASYFDRVNSYDQNLNTKISFEGKVSLPWIALYCSDVPVAAKAHKKKSINQPHFKKKTSILLSLFN